jgi:hypothetical protein
MTHTHYPANCKSEWERPCFDSAHANTLITDSYGREMITRPLSIKNAQIIAYRWKEVVMAY